MAKMIYLIGKLTTYAIIFLFLYLMWDILRHVLGNFDYTFLLHDPMSSGRKGGIFPIIVSTFCLLLVCLTFTIPVGLLSAIFLHQYSHKKNLPSRILSTSIDLLAATPSIVFGLYGNVLFSKFFGLGFSILSGGLTLGIMALPLFISTVKSGMNQIPHQHLKIMPSLGISPWRSYKLIYLPYVTTSIIAGITLSTGRALAETAALIFTSGYVDRIPQSLLDSGRSLSLHIYDLSMNVPGGENNAYNTAFTLILMIFFINLFTHFLLNKMQYRTIDI